LEAAAEDYIRRIDEMGGMKTAIEKGYPQAEIQEKAYEWQQQVDAKSRVIVGVNKHEGEKEHRISSMPHDDAAELGQRDRLAHYKAHRRESIQGFSENARIQALDALTVACESRSRMSECMVDCVRTGSTEGEIVGAMEKVWGRYRGV
jgi:methylmalonyl-CoA mutase N-terminal domain/subunit